MGAKHNRADDSKHLSAGAYGSNIAMTDTDVSISAAASRRGYQAHPPDSAGSKSSASSPVAGKNISVSINKRAGGGDGRGHN